MRRVSYGPYAGDASEALDETDLRDFTSFTCLNRSKWNFSRALYRTGSYAASLAANQTASRAAPRIYQNISKYYKILKNIAGQILENMGGYYGKYWEILNKYYVVGAHYRY